MSLPIPSTKRPTATLFGDMQAAFDFFNATLFQSKLPDVVLTLHRHPNTLGYYIPNKYRIKDTDSLGFEDSEQEDLDEIALNPDMLLLRSDKDSLSTLVHEMVHQWIAWFSIMPRRGHHCKRWAAKMKTIGLYPSSTAMPGGKETGSRVSHYIIKGGPFEKAADELLQSGFNFRWGSVAAPSGKDTKQGKRTKYTCECGHNVWGKEGLMIICEECGENFNSTCG